MHKKLFLLLISLMAGTALATEEQTTPEAATPKNMTREHHLINNIPADQWFAGSRITKEEEVKPACNYCCEKLTAEFLKLYTLTLNAVDKNEGIRLFVESWVIEQELKKANCPNFDIRITFPGPSFFSKEKKEIIVEKIDKN